MKFHDITITADGSIASRRKHETDGLAQPAVAIFWAMFARYGRVGCDWRRPIPVGFLDGVTLQWTATATVALATFWLGLVPMTTSLLLPGPAREEDDTAAVESFLLHLAKLRADSVGRGPRPLELLRYVTNRPLLATFPFAGPPDLLGTIADAETCLAAAYFAPPAPTPTPTSKPTPEPAPV